MTDLMLIRSSDFMIAFLKKRDFLETFKHKHLGSSKSKNKPKSKPRGAQRKEWDGKRYVLVPYFYLDLVNFRIFISAGGL